MPAPTLTFQRRTMLTDAKRTAIINKLVLFDKELASELDTDSRIVGIALYRMAEIASQAVSGLDGVLPLPSEDVLTLRAKARRWLTDVNPEWVDGWERDLEVLNGTWADPATSPIPLSDTADPN